MTFLSLATAAIMSALIALGFGEPVSQENVSVRLPIHDTPECSLSNGISVNGDQDHPYVYNCTCKLPDGSLSTFPNKTKCWTMHFGYNREWTYEDGVCESGECVMLPITFGCTWVTPPQKDYDDINNPPIGCTFRCWNATSNALEWNFRSEGVPCSHRDGPYGTVIKAKCRRHGNETLCLPGPPSC